jgi:hypothetical protein
MMTSRNSVILNLICFPSDTLLYTVVLFSLESSVAARQDMCRQSTPHIAVLHTLTREELRRSVSLSTRAWPEIFVAGRVP